MPRTGAFGGYSFTLDLPPGYKLDSEASPGPALKTFGFATGAREDGTRGLIQVTLISLIDVASGRSVTLDAFAESMIGGVKKRRTNWKATKADVLIASAKAIRIEWSGTVEGPAETPGGRSARGVMIVAIRGELGFSLHTQDLEPWSASEVPIIVGALCQPARGHRPARGFLSSTI
ncbi:MAG: hypothetical protein AABO57_23755 [Acidobacteriota bacterium]